MKYKKYERSEKKETRCDINLFRSYIISTRVFFSLKCQNFASDLNTMLLCKICLSVSV